MSKAIATVSGREKLAKARAGTEPLPKCAYIALGDGGADGGGQLKTPLETAARTYQGLGG